MIKNIFLNEKENSYFINNGLISFYKKILKFYKAIKDKREINLYDDKPSPVKENGEETIKIKDSSNGKSVPIDITIKESKK